MASSKQRLYPIITNLAQENNQHDVEMTYESMMTEQHVEEKQLLKKPFYYVYQHEL